MPAQSPTLSPTLSAMTAGFRGSPSGIPAPILPTRSAPTSAALVKMPPPRRAKTAIREPPKPRPTREPPASWALLAGARSAPQPDPAPRRDHPVDRAALEGDVQCRRDSAARGLSHSRVRAHREVHADE